jgi:hypothetical protein
VDPDATGGLSFDPDGEERPIEIEGLADLPIPPADRQNLQRHSFTRGHQHCYLIQIATLREPTMYDKLTAVLAAVLDDADTEGYNWEVLIEDAKELWGTLREGGA